MPTGRMQIHPMTPFFDDILYADVFCIERTEQAAVACIEAIFIVLGHSDLSKRQDPVSWDKFTEMVMGWLSRVLGLDVDTRRLVVRTPTEYVEKTLHVLAETWHKGNNTRQTFLLKDAEVMAGRLGYISETLPWLHFIMCFGICLAVRVLRPSGATVLHATFKDY